MAPTETNTDRIEREVNDLLTKERVGGVGQTTVLDAVKGGLVDQLKQNPPIGYPSQDLPAMLLLIELRASQQQKATSNNLDPSDGIAAILKSFNDLINNTDPHDPAYLQKLQSIDTQLKAYIGIAPLAGQLAQSRAQAAKVSDDLTNAGISEDNFAASMNDPNIIGKIMGANKDLTRADAAALVQYLQGAANAKSTMAAAVEGWAKANVAVDVAGGAQAQAKGQSESVTKVLKALKIGNGHGQISYEEAFDKGKGNISPLEQYFNDNPTSVAEANGITSFFKEQMAAQQAVETNPSIIGKAAADRIAAENQATISGIDAEKKKMVWEGFARDLTKVIIDFMRPIVQALLGAFNAPPTETTGGGRGYGGPNHVDPANPHAQGRGAQHGQHSDATTEDLNHPVRYADAGGINRHVTAIQTGMQEAGASHETVKSADASPPQQRLKLGTYRQVMMSPPPPAAEPKTVKVANQVNGPGSKITGSSFDVGAG